MDVNPTSVPRRDMSPRQQVRQERRRRAWRVLIMVGVAAVVLTAAVPAFGYYAVFVRPNQEIVVGVNEVEFTMGHLIKMARRTILQGQATGQFESQVTTELIIGTISEIQADEILRQVAPRFGISVTDAEIEARLRTMLDRPLQGEAAGLDRTDRTFDELYRQRLNILQLSDSVYRNVIKADIIRRLVEDRLSVEMARFDEQVFVYVIKTDERAEMQEVVRRLSAGEDFTLLAGEFSTHTLTNGRGGEWGWFPHGIQEDFEEDWFAMAPGQVSEIIDALDGQYLFWVVDYQSYREISDDHERLLKLSIVQDWLIEERRRNELYQRWDQARYRYVLDQLQKDPILIAAREAAQEAQENS